MSRYNLFQVLRGIIADPPRWATLISVRREAEAILEDPELTPAGVRFRLQRLFERHRATVAPLFTLLKAEVITQRDRASAGRIERHQILTEAYRTVISPAPGLLDPDSKYPARVQTLRVLVRAYVIAYGPSGFPLTLDPLDGLDCVIATVPADAPPYTVAMAETAGGGGGGAPPPPAP